MNEINMENNNNEMLFVFTNKINSFIVNYKSKTCQPCIVNNDNFTVNDTVNVYDRMKDDIDEIVVDKTPYQLYCMINGGMNHRIYY